MAGADLSAQLPACTSGAWETPFDHGGTDPGSPPCDPNHAFPVGNFNGLHMSLVPKGARRGWVITWDHAHYDENLPQNEARVHRWSLFDPETQTFENFCMPLPFGKGDLFCAGHAWTANGDLLVVGGTGCHQGPVCAGWGGSRLAYLWVPPDASNQPPGGTWNSLPDLDEKRWYPAVYALGPDLRNQDEDRMMVVGGRHMGNDVDSYQVWSPSGSWEPNGPSTNTFPGTNYNAGRLGQYHRMHLLSAGNNDPFDLARLGSSGMTKWSDRVSHYQSPGTWQMGGRLWGQLDYRLYNSSVLLPILGGGQFEDHLLSVGGRFPGSPPTVTGTVEWSNAGATGTPTWQLDDSMWFERWLHDTVLLPDTRVFVVGGESEYTETGCSEVPALHPEVYDRSQPAGSRWRQMLAGTIIRDYHSAALLMPNGKVLTGGGNWRHKPAQGLGGCPANPTATVFPADYQLFRPDYIECGNPRPVITGTGAASGTYAYGNSYDVTYSGLPDDGVIIERAVLVRPGSVTHHADGNQRCVELQIQYLPDAPQPTVRVTVPSKNSGLLPRGYYMLFLVSSQTVVTQGVPSEAAWVWVG